MKYHSVAQSQTRLKQLSSSKLREHNRKVKPCISVPSRALSFPLFTGPHRPHGQLCTSSTFLSCPALAPVASLNILQCSENHPALLASSCLYQCLLYQEHPTPLPAIILWTPAHPSRCCPGRPRPERLDEARGWERLTRGTW